MKHATGHAWPLRAQLLAFGLAIALPLVALLGYNLYHGAERDKRELGATALQLAQVAAQNAESFLADARRALEVLAQRPAVLALDRNACDPLLGEIRKLQPNFRHAWTVNRDGRPVCSTSAPVAATAAGPDPLHWFNQVRNSMQFTIGAPAVDLTSKRWMVTLAYPLRDARGTFIGAVTLSVDLEDYPLMPSTTALPRGSVAGIASYAGVVIARSREATRPVGSSTLQSQVRAAALVTKTGLIEVAGTDAIPRIYAYTPIPGSGWYTVAGIPATEVYAERAARFLQSVVLTLAAVLLAAAGAYTYARRVELPLRRMADTAGAVAAGDRAVRAPLAGSRETVALAGQFNAMLDALAVSERRFRETLENVHLIAVALDAQGNVTYCNDFLLNLSGWRREELLGRNWFETVIPDPAPVRAVFEQAIGEGKILLHYDNEILTRAGERRLIHWNNTILRDSANRILGTVSLGEDITARKRAEDRLRTSEARYRTLFEYAPEGIVIADPNSYYLDANASICWMLGYTRDELIGLHASDIVVQTEIQQIEPALNLIKATAEYRREWEFRRKDGSVFVADVMATTMPDGNLLGIIRDISERKQTEELLQASLRLSEYALDHTLDELLTKTLDEAELLTGSKVGFFHFLEPDQKTLWLQQWSTNTLQKMCTAEGWMQHYSVDQAGVWADCVRERRPVIHNDYPSLPHRKGLPEGHAPVIRELVVPVMRGENIVGILGLGNKPGEYDEKDIETVSRLANLVWEIVVARRAEQALEKSRNLLAETESIGNVGGWELDIDTKELTGTEEIYRIHEVDISYTLTLDQAIRFYTPASRPIIERAVQRAIEQGEPFDVELEIVTAKGNRRWVHAIGKTDLEQRRVHGFFQDITGRKRADLASKQAEEELRKRNTFIETILENAPIGFAVNTIHDGQRVFVSGSFEAIYGVPRDSINSVDDYFEKVYLDPVFREQIRERIMTDMASRDASRMRWEDIPITTHSGEHKVVTAINIPLLDQGLMISTVQDVTQRWRADEARRDSEALYHDLVETSQDLIWRCDSEGRYVYLNPAWEQVFGYKVEEMLGKRFTDFQTPETAARGLREHARLMQGGSLKSFEATHIGKKDNHIHLVFNAKFLADKNGSITGTCGTAYDITERKRAEDELRVSEQKFSKLFHANPAPIGINEIASGRLIDLNESYAKFFGYPREELIGRSAISLWADPTKRGAVIAALAETGSIRNLDVTFRRKAGEIRWGLLSFETIPFGEVPTLIAMIVDITERKRAEEALQAYALRLQDLSRRLLETQETERRNINRELHDRVGQNLAVLNLNLRLIRSGLPADLLHATGTRLDDTQKLLEATTAQVRDVMAELHPPALDDYGLYAALRVYAASFGAQANLPVNVSGSDLAPRLAPAVEMALFRIAQEALANAAKHARAQHIEVLLAASAQQMKLTIADDGVGFDAASAGPAYPSWGLSVMRERAAAAGATLTFESAPGKGTRVIVEVARGPA